MLIGFDQLIVLIRFAPYPVNIVSLMLSTTYIPLRRYAAASCIGFTKNILHVLIGASIQSLTHSDHIPPAEIAALAFGATFGIVSIVYITRKVRKAIHDLRDEEADDRQFMVHGMDEIEDEYLHDTHGSNGPTHRNASHNRLEEEEDLWPRSSTESVQRLHS